jgi:hypothetical protein
MSTVKQQVSRLAIAGLVDAVVVGRGGFVSASAVGQQSL